MSTKDKLFETALYLFSEKGYQATTIRDITSRTGLSPGSFYNHFAGKDELLQAVYDHYTKLYTHTQDPFPDYETLLAQLGPRQLFRLLNQRYIDSMRNDQLVRLTKIILMEQYTNPIAGKIAYQDRQRLLTAMEELFVHMQAHGYIRVKDPAYSGRLLGYVYLGFSSDLVYPLFQEKINLDEIALQLAEIIREYLDEVLVDPSL